MSSALNHPSREAFADAPVRYIKLGRNGIWAGRALSQGELPFSQKRVPHELATSGSQQEISDYLVNLGSNRSQATSAAREVGDFYHLGSNAIWITFADGQMWWAHAQPEVCWLGITDDYAPRMRRTLDGWHNHDLMGRPLLMDRISTRLTKVASYRQTLCRIEDESYLRRKLLGEDEPLVRRTRELQSATRELVSDLIAGLHWGDFETLTDILLGRGGWQRVSRLGGTMKDADIVLEHTLTLETAFVQVKSSSNQHELDRYIEIFDSNPIWSQMFFVCHSPRGGLEPPLSRPDVHVWTRGQLAEVVMRNGLVDWLAVRSE